MTTFPTQKPKTVYNSYMSLRSSLLAMVTTVKLMATVHTKTADKSTSQRWHDGFLIKDTYAINWMSSDQLVKYNPRPCTLPAL